jgi:hypothetical protein
MNPYATKTDLDAFLGVASPTDAERLLLRASELLDAVCVAAFDVDSDTDLPADTDIAAALRDAACAQVEQWVEVGEANAIDGLDGTQFSLSGYSGRRAPRLAPRARDILHAAGLLTYDPGATW